MEAWSLEGDRGLEGIGRGVRTRVGVRVRARGRLEERERGIGILNARMDIVADGGIVMGN